ncbi:DUF1963 domain-containing protein [Pleomorphomonas oryzae]|uniref:DUF1963 domain-containing protein n=1 Tax=Pleomorphomonas oryzae TaxID=261934 RepID=UPI0004791BB9|nr:DUF1963 domain-containing protein [Pleomorphomonas oryzae]
MIVKWVVLAVAALMSLSAPAIRPALAAEGLKFTNAVSTISGFFSGKLNMFMRPDDATQAGKQTSVILKRQVPIRFGEAPRSWLGGLPMMPENVAWPRAANGSPLHFIAEIDCADLPANLWNGLGPRQGWLLLFVEVQQLDYETDGDLVQVLHIDQLGPERQPPEDMSTVRLVMWDLIGGQPKIRPGVPKMWRKWPVDLVVQEYTPSDDEAEGPPLVSGEELYEAPVSDRGFMAFSVGLDRPLTWRGALYYIQEFLRDLEPERFKLNFTNWQGGLLQPPEPGADGAGLMAQALEGLDKIKARLREHDEVRLAELEKQRDYLTRINDSRPGPEGDAFIAEEIETLGEGHLAWAAGLRSAAESLMAHILAQDLDAPMSDDDWRSIAATFKSKSVFWQKTHFADALERVERGLSTDDQLRMAIREDALDAYARNNATNPAIPRDLLDDVEARLRFINEGRPHRMGGQPSLIQPHGPMEDAALLFQMASDQAMGWNWADVGALYVTISLDDLRKGQFDRLHAWQDGY